jgi:hypothetical protein
MPDDPRGDEVRVDVHDSDHLIYVSEGTRIYESKNGGETFEQTAGQFAPAKAFDIEVSSKGDPERIYV